MSGAAHLSFRIPVSDNVSASDIKLGTSCKKHDGGVEYEFRIKVENTKDDDVRNITIAGTLANDLVQDTKIKC